MFPEALDIAEVKSKMTEHPAEAPFVIESAKTVTECCRFIHCRMSFMQKREFYDLS
ncbi:hypothetical protein QNN00_20810 [Bacillus velezensis]|nr:hypothetical protein [Bacillus velezensis]